MSRLKALEQAERLEGSLIEFYKQAWEVIDPAPYVHGWHLEAIAEHLEAVSRGELRKLLITMPPRHSKSILTSVVWPAWTWCKEHEDGFPLIGPQTKFLALSYSDTLTLDLALLQRRLVISDWYQKRWGDRVQLTVDQEAKSKFDTSAGGTRISVSFQGTVTGRGGDIKIIDDPIKPDEAESEVVRDKVLRIYDGTLKSRITDPRINAEVVIMQRLAEKDLAGHILSTDFDFEHLMLPAEFEPHRRYHTSLGWTDPRTEEGELLWPERFGKKELAQYRRDPYEWAGQWQQRPEIRGGAIIKRQYWRPYVVDKGGKIPACSYIVASLDPAYEQKASSDPNGFTIWGVWYDERGHSRIIALDAWRKRLDIQADRDLVERRPEETYPEWVRRTREHWQLVEWVEYSCRRFKVDRLLIENKASGKSVAQTLRTLNKSQNWGTTLIDPKGQDKVARVWAIQHMFADGMVFMPVFSDGSPREWGQILEDECAVFPKGSTDDLVDSTSQALKHIRDIGLAVRKDERAQMEADMARHEASPPPLYDV